MLGDNRPVNATPPEAGSSTTAPSSGVLAGRPDPSRPHRRPIPSPESQNRRRSKAYVGSSTKAAPPSTPRQSTRHAGDERGGGRRQEPFEPAVFATQGGDDDGHSASPSAQSLAVSSIPAINAGMRTGFDEGAVAVLAGAAHRLVELHGLADVAIPVFGVQTRCVQTVSGHRGEEDGARRARLDAGQNLGELATDRLDLDRMRGIVDVDPAGAQVQVGAEARRVRPARRPPRTPPPPTGR